MPHLTLKMG